MTIAELIKQARVAKRWTQQELADAVGVTRNTISQWENGETAPKRDRQQAVIAALGLKHDALSPLSVSGISVVDLSYQKVINLPVYNMSAITMRTGGELKFGVSDGNITVEHNLGSNCFAAKVSDEAMSPLYGMGDVIIVHRDTAPTNDDDVVAGAPGGVLMLRQYRALGRNSRGIEAYELRSTNPDYPTIPMDSIEGLMVVGVVVEHRRRRRG